MCLQQVGQKGVWLRFHDVERILGMYTGEIQDMWSDIRPKEHRMTRQKTGVYLVKGYVAVVDPGGAQAGVAGLEIPRSGNYSSVC